MPRYLLQVTYTAEGAKGLLKDGGSKRQAAARALVESLGGKLECFYFAFGTADAVVIAEMPDNVAVAAAAIALGGSGAVHNTTTVLLSPDEIDRAVKQSASYTPPGR